MSSMLAAIVLAAGRGTRMRSDRPKVLHTAAGRPLVAHVIDAALSAGVQQVLVVVGHGSAEVETALRRLFPRSNLSFAVQTEQRGTGHAVECGLALLAPEAHDVLILSGDAPLVYPQTLRDLVSTRRVAEASLSLATMRPVDAHGYGRIIRSAAGRVERIVEEKDASPAERSITEANAGFYCAERRFLVEAIARLSPDNAQGELYLTDIVKYAPGSALPVLIDPVEASGVNDRAQLAGVEASIRQRINTAHMRTGVTLRDPATTYIDHGVTIGLDTEVEPGVSVRGRTSVGANVRIGQGSVLVDCDIGDGVSIAPYSHIEGARVGDRAHVGPFARLRPGTELAEDVHIGNFVETKKARIGRGSKAGHLAYLGDAIIGAECNIGAGTITCNYDGVHKHVTTLGDRVFIGSDSQLVAPVTVGSGAYVGAGSTITRDVEADALAVSRAPTVVRSQWAQRRRDKLQQTSSAPSSAMNE